MKSFVFDIESAPLPEAELAGMLPVFNPDDVKVGLRKPETAVAYIEERRKEHDAKVLERAALSPFTGSIVAIGIMGPDSALVEMLVGDEPAMIKKLFRYIEETAFVARWVGFNITEFDIPFLVRRAWKLGIPIPSNIFHGRYLSSSLVDLAQVWKAGAYEREIPSLDRLARFLGCGSKTANGSAFAAMLYQDQEAALEYLRNDLALTWKIAETLGVITKPELAEHDIVWEWQTAAEAETDEADDRKGFDPIREDPIRFE